jgi:hypothetical protein
VPRQFSFRQYRPGLGDRQQEQWELASNASAQLSAASRGKTPMDFITSISTGVFKGYQLLARSWRDQAMSRN